MNPMNLVRNYFSQAQDVLSDSTKDRLVNVYRHGSTTGSHMAGHLSRDEQALRGQQDFLEIKDFSSKKLATQPDDLDIHLQQQSQLKGMRR